MKVRSFNIDSLKNEYGIVVFSKPDVVVINPQQVTLIEDFQFNGVREFDIYDSEKDKKRKGTVFRLFFTSGTRVLYIDETDAKKVEGLLK